MNRSLLMGLLMDAASDADAGGGGGGVDVDALQARIAALESEVTHNKTRATEAEETARYWADRAKKEGTTVEKAKAAAADDEDDDDVLSIAAKGGGALKAWLQKQGLVTADEVDRRMNAKTEQVMQEANLTKKYSDLADTDSEFFKDTAKEYGKLKASGVPEHLCLSLAAKTVNANYIESGKKVSGAATAEAERQARIKAQSTSTKGIPSGSDEQDETLSAHQESIIEQMADAAGVDVDEFRKGYVARAKAGVMMQRGGKK